MRPHNKTFFGKVSKILPELSKVFNFEKFPFMFNRNLLETSYTPVVIFLKGNLTQNVYSCKFHNVKNEFNVTNVSSYKFLKHFSIN